jgi:hypothetical protein
MARSSASYAIAPPRNPSPATSTPSIGVGRNLHLVSPRRRHQCHPGRQLFEFLVRLNCGSQQRDLSVGFDLRSKR